MADGITNSTRGLQHVITTSLLITIVFLCAGIVMYALNKSDVGATLIGVAVGSVTGGAGAATAVGLATNGTNTPPPPPPPGP